MNVYLSESDDDDEILILAAMLADEENDGKIKRKCWVHNINKDRELFGEYNTLMVQLRMDPARFFMYFRMTSECYEEVLSLIESEIRKMPTHFRIKISPTERLAICLRYLLDIVYNIKDLKI
ncbi:unnamed protein product [Macrosiphum euphorbiae]|uniref:Protein ALP1-like n=1 Tax=Macrosiphum euphorbiae TaxID=13131 RepID=A0AAV0Y0I8_9HEMI|nr:unnamed protein product [Macrosiphum euphorbiae]